MNIFHLGYILLETQTCSPCPIKPFVFFSFNPPKVYYLSHYDTICIQSCQINVRMTSVVRMWAHMSALLEVISSFHEQTHWIHQIEFFSSRIWILKVEQFVRFKRGVCSKSGTLSSIESCGRL